MFNVSIIDHKNMIDVWFPYYVIVSHGIFILYDYLVVPQKSARDPSLRSG